MTGASVPPAPAAAAHPVRPWLAFAWMCGAIASFTLSAVAGREAQVSISAVELAAWRSVLALGLVCGLLALHPRGFAQIRTALPWLHLQRNVIHFAGQIAWFVALTLIPLAQLIAFEFTNPIWVALLAPFLLGERVTRRLAAAIALGFVGVLIVARPEGAGFGQGQALALFAAFAFALNAILTRRIMAQDTVLCVVFWMAVIQACMGFAGVLAMGAGWPPAGAWGWIALVAVTGLSGHYCLTSALGHAPASLVAPMDFLRLPAVTVVGALVYGESVSVSVFLGAVVILAANLLSFSDRRGTDATARRG